MCMSLVTVLPVVGTVSASVQALVPVGACTGGYTGGVLYRVPTYPARFARGEVPRQRSGPRRPCRAGVGGLGSSGELGDGGGPRTHPSGPVGSLRLPPWFWALIAALQPRGEIKVPFL